MLRARFAYFKVFKVSSALISAGLMQAGKGKYVLCKKKKLIKAQLVLDATWMVRKENQKHSRKEKLQ